MTPPIRCPRCLHTFPADPRGRVPLHERDWADKAGGLVLCSGSLGQGERVNQGWLVRAPR